MTYKGHHDKQSQMPNWIAPLQSARRDDQNGYIICIVWSLNEKDGKRK
jgi:hypothetical protein